MDVNALMQAIGTLGFPIVAAGALFWRMERSDERHREEMDKLSTALANNTQALVRLSERLKERD